MRKYLANNSHIQQDTNGMRKYLANNSVEQMPQVSGEGRLDFESLFQLPCDRFDQSTFARECPDGLFGQRRIFLVNTTHR
ncbi:MAG: hypothetical protein ACYSWO_24470, partial [Planctomycetota bacterium]